MIVQHRNCDYKGSSLRWHGKAGKKALSGHLSHSGFHYGNDDQPFFYFFITLVLFAKTPITLIETRAGKRDWHTLKIGA
jgi:hypothetical protein